MIVLLVSQPNPDHATLNRNNDVNLIRARQCIKKRYKVDTGDWMKGAFQSCKIQAVAFPGFKDHWPRNFDELPRVSPHPEILKVHPALVA